MSNENTTDNDHPFVISPDPKIKITTAGTGTDYSSVTFTRQHGYWEQSQGGKAPTIYTKGSPVELVPKKSSSEDGDIGRVEVIIKDSSGMGYMDAEKLKIETEIQPLKSNSTTFEFDVAAGEQFDFRISGGDLITPGVCYYVRQPLGSGYLYAAQGDPNGQGHDYIVGAQYQNEYDAAFLWIFLPTTTANEYSCYILSEKLFASGTSGNLQTNGDATPYLWNAADGTLSYNPSPTSNLNLGWTAGSNGSSIQLEDISSGASPSQKWSLVPAILGPLATGAGVLGAS